jgi:hypothetical protein
MERKYWVCGRVTDEEILQTSHDTAMPVTSGIYLGDEELADVCSITLHVHWALGLIGESFRAPPTPGRDKCG